MSKARSMTKFVVGDVVERFFTTGSSIVNLGIETSLNNKIDVFRYLGLIQGS
ncbi:MAG: hypothetical protein WBP64_06870 [Nitrososphaeraceae archaeon]|jgi:hypothetical protein